MDRMGNVLCSMNSCIDFPPLIPQLHTRNQFSVLGQMEEQDRSEGPLEESYFSNNSSKNSLSDSSLNTSMDKSFQEVLCREKALKKEDGVG